MDVPCPNAMGGEGVGLPDYMGVPAFHRKRRELAEAYGVRGQERTHRENTAVLRNACFRAFRAPVRVLQL